MRRLILSSIALFSLGCGTTTREVPTTNSELTEPSEGPPPIEPSEPSAEETEARISEERSACIAGTGMFWSAAANRIWVAGCPRGEPCASGGNVVGAGGRGPSYASRGDRFVSGSQAGQAWLASVHGTLRDENMVPSEQPPRRPSEGAFQVVACSPDGCRSLTDDLAAPANPTARLVLPYARDTFRQLALDQEAEVPPSAEDQARRRRVEALDNARANPQRVQQAGPDGQMLVVATNFQILIETGEGSDALGGLGPVIIASPTSLNVQLPDFQSQRPNLFNQTAAAMQLTALVEGVLPSAQVHTFWPPAAGHRRFHIVRDTGELWVVDVPVCGPVPAPLRAFAEAGSHAVAVVREAMHLPPEACPR